jgi:hypothetical protein
MKRKNLVFIMLLLFFSLFTIQSCKKDAPIEPTVYLAAMPEAPVPASDAIIAFTGSGQTINLAWTGTATNAIAWDVYFGDSDAPGKVATGLTANAYTARITTGGTYYWQVITTDANNVTTKSPVWSFQVNSKPDVPVLTAPANNATLVSNTAALTWTCTDPQEDDLTFDVYFGKTATPGPVATGLTVLTYSPTLDYNTTYYWKIVAKDPYGGTSTSAVFKFTTDVQKPDYNVFNGTASELSPSISATRLNDVAIQRLGKSNVLSLFLPLADAMVAAGWGTVYTGTHPILVTYDPATLVVTGAKQAWCDSFIDPTEMGPMFLTVEAGSKIDPLAKKISIIWTVSGNDYWGDPFTMKAATYTMK